MEVKRPKILVFTVAAWNSRVGSNTWATLLKKYGSENVANICIRDEVPDSDVCSRYFAISEGRVIKSILNRKIKTGREVIAKACENNTNELAEHNERYRKMKKNRRYSMLLAREAIWKLGVWKTEELNAFLDDFKPDIILHSMEGYIHLNRIIEYAVKRTGAKAAGYIWDDNFTYKQSSNFGYKIYRFFQRRSLKKLAAITDEFFAISDMTKLEADEFFGIDCRILTKPLNSLPSIEYGEIQKPIKMLYTGKLIIGRDRSLLRVANVAKRYNGEFEIDVYTPTELPDSTRSKIESKYCRIHKPIPQSEVLKLQKEADVLLLLEDIDGRDCQMARLSFSTKTTDYLSSGKCIFAIGCENTAPMQYFKKNEAAITAFSDEQISKGFEAIDNDTGELLKYAEKAYNIGIENHSPERVQAVFDDVISTLFAERV